MTTRPHMADKVVEFILNALSSLNVHEDEKIQIVNESVTLCTEKQVKKWLHMVRRIVGYHEYNRLKLSFRISMKIDVGFEKLDDPETFFRCWCTARVKNNV